MSFWQEAENNAQQFVDQEPLFIEPHLLILADAQINASGESFLSWDDLIGQR